jgi:RNA polymerase sigma-70 factor (ECF subfamily)
MDEDPRFQRMYQRLHPRVLAYCLRRLPAADAGDAAAEVFATAWRRRHDMPRGDQALPWLYGVARNVLRHHWRATGRRRNLATRAGTHRAPPPLTPDEVLVEHEDYVKVREALGRLSPQDQEVLMLSAWEGLSHAEMSAALGVSMAAVDKRLVRAKKRLARQFDGVTGSGSATGGGGGIR